MPNQSMVYVDWEEVLFYRIKGVARCFLPKPTLHLPSISCELQLLPKDNHAKRLMFFDILIYRLEILAWVKVGAAPPHPTLGALISRVSKLERHFASGSQGLYQQDLFREYRPPDRSSESGQSVLYLMLELTKLCGNHSAFSVLIADDKALYGLAKIFYESEMEEMGLLPAEVTHDSLCERLYELLIRAHQRKLALAFWPRPTQNLGVRYRPNAVDDEAEDKAEDEAEDEVDDGSDDEADDEVDCGFEDDDVEYIGACQEMFTVY